MVKRSLGVKLLAVQLSLIVVALTALVWCVSTMMTQALDEIDRDSRAMQTAEVIDRVGAFEEAVREEVSRLSRLFIAQHGLPITSDDTRLLRAGGESAPTLEAGGEVLNGNLEHVDRFAAATGGFATVFARRGDEFVRVATSVKKENGERALGTFLDHASPAYASALRGEQHVGKVSLFGRDLMTLYEPIEDSQNRVVGIWFVSLDFHERLKALKTRIEALRVGKRGYFYVVDATPGPGFGTFVAHPTLSGRPALDLKDDRTGRAFIREMLEKKRGTGSYEHMKEERSVVYDQFQKWNWLIVGANYAEDLRETTGTLRRWLIGLGALMVAVLATALMLSVRRLVSQPLLGAVRATRQIAGGDLSCKLQADSEDEVGQLVRALGDMAGALNAVVAELRVVIVASQGGRISVRGNPEQFEGVYAELVVGINALLDNLVKPLRFVAQNTDALASSAEELTAVSRQLGGNADETSEQVLVVAAAAEEVSRTTQTVALSTQQMAATIRDIAKNAADSAQVAAQAVAVAESTNATVAKLGASALAIGRVIKVITSIAQQTNLLALNATIEAARAGEAGKGFAVVAHEVKELANETARATDDVGRSVESIQTDTQEAVAAIAAIRAIIGRIHDIASSIAGAVEEQSATTSEMDRSVGEAAKGADDIARNITRVTDVARSTAQGAGQTQQAATDLARMAEELKQLFSTFVIDGADDAPVSGAPPPRRGPVPGEAARRRAA